MILVLSETGKSVPKLTLEDARTSLDCANKTIIITSALTAAQSNITGAWPTDRILRVEKGGSIANSTAFTIGGPFEAGLYQVFAGTGAVTFNNLNGTTTPATSPVKEIPVVWWNAKGDGLEASGNTNTLAFQAAIDSVKSLSGGEPTRTIDVIVPEGKYFLGSTVNLYGGARLRGYGRKSLLVAGPTLTGSILALQSVTGTDFCYRLYINNLAFQNTGSVWAIKAISEVIANGEISDITLNSSFGIYLATYSQSMLVENIMSIGPLDQMLHMAGNHNHIRNLDKEASYEGGHTGSTTDPYILFEHRTYPTVDISNGNTMEMVLIEQITSANKTPIVLNGVSNFILKDVWIEPTLTTGFGLQVTGSDRVVIDGYYQTLYSTNNKILIETSSVYWKANFQADAEDVPAQDLITIDSVSAIIIDHVNSRRNTNAFIVNRMPIIRNQKTKYTLAKVAGNERISEIVFSGANLLVNPDFIAGSYKWAWNSGTPTVTYEASPFGRGQVMKSVFGTVGTQALIQDFTITPEMVGVPLTFTAYIKVEGGTATAGASPFLDGGGLTGTNELSRAITNTGWQVVNQTIIPAAAATLHVGIYNIFASTIYTTGLSLRAGIIGMPSQSAFGSISLGGVAILSGLGSPETVISAPVGSMFLRTDGGTGITFYIKELGMGTTGWVAK